MAVSQTVPSILVVYTGRVLGVLDGTGKTLVLLRIIVLQGNLQLNRLPKLPRLVLGSLQNGGNGLVQRITADFAEMRRGDDVLQSA